MLKKFLIALVVTFLMVSGGAGAQEAPIPVGAIIDLSGPTFEVGRPYAEGMSAYIEAFNAAGGINGRSIVLLLQDYAYDTPTAVRLYEQFVGQGAVAIMGWGTGDTEALAGSAAADEIPYIAASYSDLLNDPNGNAPYNFVIATSYGDQLEIMLTYMVEQWEAAGNRASDMGVAIFHDDNPFGEDPIEQGLDAADWLGIGGYLAIKMPRSASTYVAELQQADDYGVTHIIVQSTARPAVALVRDAARFYGAGSVQIGCLNWCASELLIAGAGDAAEGVIGAMPFAPASARVRGQDEPREALAVQGRTLEDASLHYSQGWAAMEILVAAMELTADSGGEITGPNILAALESFDRFDTGGLLPPLSFTPSDHRGTRALTIYVVENGEWVEASDEYDLR